MPRTREITLDPGFPASAPGVWQPVQSMMLVRYSPRSTTLSASAADGRTVDDVETTTAKATPIQAYSLPSISDLRDPHATLSWLQGTSSRRYHCAAAFSIEFAQRPQAAGRRPGTPHEPGRTIDFATQRTHIRRVTCMLRPWDKGDPGPGDDFERRAGHEPRKGPASRPGPGGRQDRRAQSRRRRTQRDDPSGAVRIRKRVPSRARAGTPATSSSAVSAARRDRDRPGSPPVFSRGPGRREHGG